MTPLTPLDVENLRLRPSLRGYDRNDVDAFHREVVATLEEYVDQVAGLKTRVRELEKELDRSREQEDGVKNSLMLAQRTADELVSAARERAEALLQQARAEAADYRRSVADIVAQREQFEYQFHGLLSGFLRRLEQANPHLASPANGRAYVPQSSVVNSMDTQYPQGTHDLDMDMEDLTVQEIDQLPQAQDGDDAVVLPMALPTQTAPADYARRLDSDSVAFTAALDSAALRPELLAEAQVPVSGSNVHEQAEQVADNGGDESTMGLQDIANQRLRDEDDPGQPEVVDAP
jgi:cell division initiation protein